MAHIALPENIPGIRAGFTFRPETAAPLLALAEAILRGPSPLTPAERELVAVVVSSGNACGFCRDSHRAAAAHCMGGDYTVVDAVLKDLESAPVSDKMKALLAIARKVRVSGKEVSADDVARAKAAGASDVEVHDTVLVAAAFSMFNRYVDGLGAWTPEGHDAYDGMGQRLATSGYTLQPTTSR